MAEAIIIPVFARLLSKLASPAFKDIALICGAQEEFAKLKDTFSLMQTVLLDAEQKADQSPPVKDWLGKLKDAAYVADDLLDELSYETMRREVISRDTKAKKVRIFFSKHNQLAFAVKMVHKIKKLRQRLEFIAADRNQFQFLETIPNQSRTKDREDTISLVREEEVIGRDEEKEEIVKRLLVINEKQNVSVDAIVGLGGLGKTMLAQSVFNHKRVEDAFDLRLWVCISETFDLKIIVEKIIEAASKQSPSGLGMDPLQNELRKQIDEKKYLLVMDDLWNEDGERWAGLKRLLMGGAKGSKILITTRSERVAKVSEATFPYILKGLSESNSWILFKQMAFTEGEEPESPNMIEIGKEIARECMGVPLVIRTIGRLLNSKPSEDVWSSFKNSELSTFTQQENKITQVLKLSYNHLPSHLKPCFAYCSLFPKDYEFKKDELIKLWVAEGFVQSQGKNKCLEDVGEEYFMELIWRSIFQDVERNIYGDVLGCKMHDLMHDLSRSVAGAECFTLTPDSNIENANERTRHVSFDYDGKSKWSALFTSQLEPYKLRTFLSLSTWFYSLCCELNETGLEAHISSLKSLRVLDLKWFLMRKVPFSIGMLKHLRFLNLSGNGEIKSLPSSVAKLHFLQTLHLKRCLLLRELPEDIESLVNLRHLDISETALVLLPSSVTKLQFLQTLHLKKCSLLKKLPEDIGSLVKLRHLDISATALELLPISVTKLRFLQTLYLKKCSLLRELPEDIGSLVNLRHLDISKTALELLPSSVTKLQFLQTLHLKKCSLLRELPEDIENLVNLRHLDLSNNKLIERLPNSTSKLLHLQKLILNDCESLIELPNNIGNMVDLRFLHLSHNKCIELLPNSISKLQKLQLLDLGHCTSLRELPRDVSNLINLKHLDLEDCDGLRGMPLGLNKLTGLQTMNLYVLGPSVSYEDSGLWQLNTLINIRGKLRIRGLHHLRKDSSQANTVNLKDNHGVRDLTLDWGKIGYNLNGIDSDFVVLEKLHPNKNVEKLRIDRYGGVRLSSWVSLLSNLTYISILNCKRLQYLPRFDQLPNLQNLWLRNLNFIEYMDNNETVNEFHSSVFFPSLKSLTLWNMDKLKGWWKSMKFTPKDHAQTFLLPSFHCLSDLTIIDCPQMFSIPSPNSSLRLLRLTNYNASPEDDTQWEALDGRDDLHLKGVPKLTTLLEGFQHLTALQYLYISGCNDLVMLPNWIGNLTSLHTLKIRDCPKLILLPEGQLSSLRSLTICGCGRLEERCQPQIGEDWSKIAHVEDINIGW